MSKIHTTEGLGNIGHTDLPSKLVLNITVHFVTPCGDPLLFIPMKPNLGLFSPGSGCSLLTDVNHYLVNLWALEIRQASDEN